MSLTSLAWRSRRVGIFVQLLLAFLLVALLPLTTLWQLERTRITRDGREDAHERLKLFSDRVVQQVDDWTQQNLSVLKLAASLPEAASMDPVAHKRIVESVARQLPWAYLVHTANLTGMNVARSDARPPASYGFRRYYADVLRGAEYSADVQIGLTSQQPAFHIAVPIHDSSGQLRGVLIEAATLDAVSRAVTSVNFGRTGFAFLMTPEGRLIANAHEPAREFLKDYSTHPAFVAAKQGHEGIQNYVVDGVERTAMIRRTNLGWIAVAQQNTEESLAGVNQANRGALFLLVVTAALVTLVSLTVARSFANPIERVTEVANQISQGNLDFSISTTRRDQIGDLVHAMNGVRATLQRFVAAERHIVEAAARGDFSERGDESSFQNAFRDMMRHLNHLMDTADRGLAEVATVLAAVAKGDLAAQMQGTYAGTFADLKRDINTTVEALATLIRQIEFNRGLLRATLEHLPQGVSVVDSQLRLIAWNRRYLEIFDYPDDLVHVGQQIETLMRYNAARGLLGSGDVEANIQRRADHIRTARPHARERELPNGVVLEIHGNPVPDVGYVTSYTDVSAYKRVEAQLRALAESLERRVAERTDDLQRAMAKAARANRSKSKFLAAAVHDLSQPINATRLYLSALEEDLRSQPEAADLARHAERSLASVEGLLGSLMDISRLESGKLKLNIKDVSLGPVLESLAHEFRMLAQSRGLELDCVATREAVRTDIALLRRVLQNFLSNAVRYTSSGRILLGVRRAHGALRIEVWDTGCGIPANKTEEIFEEFRRLNSQRADIERGAGLGLAIVRTIAQLLQHPVTVRSRVGRGSVFSIEVPLGEASRLQETPDIAPSGEQPLRDRKVWCIDDDRDVREATRKLLERWGCQVTLCIDGDECLRNARRSDAPDLLILDYRLGDCAGPDLLPELNAIWNRTVPVIIVSGEHASLLRKALREAPWPVLAKPVRPEELRAGMLTLLAPEPAET